MESETASKIEHSPLNDDWIKTFEDQDNLYKDFYKGDLYYVNLKIIYINRENDIDKIRDEPFIMSYPNHVTREEVIQILKRNIIDDNRHYSLLSILKYNITIDVDDIRKLLSESTNISSENEYLTAIKHIDAISLEKTINMFHDLNELVFIFYEKSSELICVDPNNSTKKIYLRKLNSNKKTIKKRYKP
jgi:hypothetical protein